MGSHYSTTGDRTGRPMVQRKLVDPDSAAAKSRAKLCKACDHRRDKHAPGGCNEYSNVRGDRVDYCSCRGFL